MDTNLNTVMKVFESLVKLNSWNVERFDIQAYNHSGFSGYAGYAYIKGYSKNLVIHGDGSFEWC